MFGLLFRPTLSKHRTCVFHRRKCISDDGRYVTTAFVWLSMLYIEEQCHKRNTNQRDERDYISHKLQLH